VTGFVAQKKGLFHAEEAQIYREIDRELLVRALSSMENAIEKASYLIGVGSAIIMMLRDLYTMGRTHNPADLIEVGGLPIVGDSAVVVVINPMLFTTHCRSPACRDWSDVKPAWRQLRRLDS
jgi:hypothetical protein